MIRARFSRLEDGSTVKGVERLIELTSELLVVISSVEGNGRSVSVLVGSILDTGVGEGCDEALRTS